MKKILMFLAIIPTFMLSCSESPVELFDDKELDGIYFQRDAGYSMDNNGMITQYTYGDSVETTLSSLAADRLYSILSVPIKVYGLPSNVDRKVGVKINEELTTAVQGRDFEIDLDTIYIYAGQIKGNLRVKLLRSPEIAKKKFRVAFDLVENENFKFIIRDFKGNSLNNSTAKTMSALTFKVIFSDIITCPTEYTWFAVDAIGPWSVKRFNLVNKLMGWTYTSWKNKWGQPGNPSYGKMSYAAYILQDHLQNLADKGTPEYDEDGSLMQLPGKYAVDYSAYEK